MTFIDDAVTPVAPGTTLRDALRRACSRPVVLRAVGTCAAAVGTLLPVLWTPYAGDDTVNATLPEVMARDHSSWWDVVSSLTTQWIRGQGRFFPGSVAYGTTVFMIFTSRLAYKAYVVAMLLAALVVFARWIRSVTGSAAPALLGVMVVLSTWQFRSPVWHDSVTSYAALLPYTCMLMFGALVLIAPSGRHRGWLRYVGAGVLWALAAVTYEVVVPLAPAAVATLWLRRASTRARLWGALAIAVPTVVDLVIVAVIRARVEGPTAPGYTLRLAPAKVLATTWQQMVAALPLSQRWSAASSRPAAQLGSPALLVGAGVAVLVAAALWTVWTRGEASEDVDTRLLALIGLWLWVVPSALVGATQRWQDELPAGQGYLSVMFESFGLALLAVCLVTRGRGGVHRRRPPVWAVACICLVALAVAANAACNVGVAVRYW